MAETSQVYPWIKLYTKMLDEPKLARLSEGACWRYVQLALLAGRAAAGGALAFGDEPATVEDIAWTLRIDADKLRAQLDELTRAGLVALEGGAYVLTRFLDEQGPGEGAKREQERAKWRKRQARHRAKVTGTQEAELDTEAESDLDTELDLEQELELECHGDVTVTESEFNKPVGLHRQGAGASAIKPSVILRMLEQRHQENPNEPAGPFDTKRIERAIEWVHRESEHQVSNGKAPLNFADAVLERYDLLATRARIDRTRVDITDLLTQEAQQHDNQN